MLSTVLAAIPAILTSAGGMVVTVAGGVALLMARRNERDRIRYSAVNVLVWLQDHLPHDLRHQDRSLWENMPTPFQDDLAGLAKGHRIEDSDNDGSSTMATLVSLAKEKS